MHDLIQKWREYKEAVSQINMEMLDKHGGSDLMPRVKISIEGFMDWLAKHEKDIKKD